MLLANSNGIYERSEYQESRQDANMCEKLVEEVVASRASAFLRLTILGREHDAAMSRVPIVTAECNVASSSWHKLLAALQLIVKAREYEKGDQLTLPKSCVSYFAKIAKFLCWRIWCSKLSVSPKCRHWLTTWRWGNSSLWRCPVWWTWRRAYARTLRKCRVRLWPLMCHSKGLKG